ncbi:recombinase RecA [Archaeoglobales archaeon]|nr:MAG: recombinase RecA [Archaeoglobales archaeon]
MSWALKEVLDGEIKKGKKEKLKPQKKVDVEREAKKTVRHDIRDGLLPTGIELLDKKLNGGLPRGSFICVYGDPVATPEAFLYQFSEIRKTYYINTSRSAIVIRDDMKRMGFEVNDVNFIDVYSNYYLNPVLSLSQEERDKEIVDFTIKEIQKVIANESDAVNIIVDNYSFFVDLNVPPNLKDFLLNRLYNAAKENDGFVAVYLLKDSHPKKTIVKIFDISDIIFFVDVSVTGSRFVKLFGIPKIRGMVTLNDIYKFEVSEGVQVDTSRDIA